MRALVTGATGFVGRRLVERLDGPVVLSRDAERARKSLAADVTAHDWDPLAGPPPAEALDGVEAVYHLAGESVAQGRWTAAKKQRIRDSRVLGTRHLAEAIAASSAPPKVLISASAVGYYGSQGDRLIDETAPAGDDFLAEVCRAWEAESQRVREAGVRLVNPRIGVVLGRGGGALAKMLTPFKLCVGGRLGDGRQYMPWIHLDDLVGMILHAAEHDEMSGPMNATAPNPVTNREFTRALARVLGRPAIFPAPKFALKLLFGEFAEALFDSQRVVPRAAEAAGYEFRYPGLEPALRAILE